jgi:hypothetical protein
LEEGKISLHLEWCLWFASDIYVAYEAKWHTACLFHKILYIEPADIGFPKKKKSVTYCTVPENNFTKFNAAANNAVNLGLFASFVWA